jgi:plastocyanin
MMTLIQYDGAVPTGPIAEFFRPDGGVSPEGTDHTHGGSEALAPVETPSSLEAHPAATEEPSGPDGTEVEIAMLDDRFDPPELTVAAGTTVRFVNRGANWHSVAAFDGSFDSGRVDPESSFAVRLDVPGVYDIICKHHGLRGMVGRVTVT